MANHTVPAAAEGMPKFNDLEDPICDAADFARVADFVAARVFGEFSSTEPTMLMPWQVELILFTGLQAKLAAERTQDAFHDVIEERAR